MFLLLRVEELLVVNHSADRGIRSSSNLDEVQILIICNLHCLLKRVDALLYVVADKAHLGHTFDFVINTVRILFDNSTAARSDGGCCYSFFLLNWVNNQKACKITTFFLYTQEK